MLKFAFRMELRSRLRILLFLAGPILLSACAATSGGPLPLETNQTPVWLTRFEESGELFRRGAARRDAILVAVAAEMRAEALRSWVVENDDADVVTDALEMIELARSLAQGDPHAEAIVERRAAKKHRGAVSGPIVTTGAARRGNDYSTDVDFEDGLPAVVYIETISAAPIEFAVQKSEGGDLCRDRAISRKKICRWTAAENSRVRIDVATRSDEPLEFLLITN